MKHPLDQVLIEIGSIDKYCTASQESSSTLSLILKELYDRAVIDSRKRVGPLLTLSVNGLDDETIWEQLQTRNKPLVRFSTKIVKRLKRRLDLAPLREDSNDTEDASIEADSDSDGFEHADGAGASDDEMSQDDLLQADEDEEGDFDEENDDYVQSDEDMHEMEDGGGVTVTGDSEDDMEAFLDAEDEKEMRRFFKEDKKGKDKQINVSTK